MGFLGLNVSQPKEAHFKAGAQNEPLVPAQTVVVCLVALVPPVVLSQEMDIPFRFYPF